MKEKYQQRGASIIEVLIAAFILAGALFALVSFQLNLMRDRSLLAQKEYAIALAQDKMQSFRNYTALNTTPGQFAYADIISAASNTTVNGTTYNMTWTVTNSPNPPTRKNVVITVTWTDETGVAQTVGNGGVRIESIIVRIDPALTGQVSEGLPP